MFEHLGPPKKKSKAQKTVNFKFYTWFMLLALFIFASSWGLSQGTGSQAQNQPQISATVLAMDTNAKNILINTPRLSVFDFVIKANLPQVFLNELEISVQGVYDEDWLEDLRLYHEDTQLGQITNLTEYDGLYFDLGQYKLTEGENYFQLRLTSASDLSLADAATFSIVEPLDVILSYQDHYFTPEGEFPIAGQEVVVITNGQLLSYNNLTDKDFSLPANYNNRLADFSLDSQSETMTIQQVIIDYDAEVDLTNNKFYLSHNGQIVSQTIATNQAIIFQTTEPLIVKNNQDIGLELWGALPESGQYQFTLSEVIAKGFISGENVGLQKDLALSQIQILANVPYFEVSAQPTILSTGWNDLFIAEIINTAGKEININKLSWQLQNHGVQITNLELWVNDQPYPTKLNLKNDTITANFGESKPLVINTKVKLQLLVKVKLLAEDTRLQVNLLSDEAEEVTEDDNLLWSIDNEQYNGYLLPNFPLDPAVLSN